MTFEEFAATRLQTLLKYAVVLTGDHDLAQDVLQEVLARAQVRWARIAKSDSPDAYVRRMLVNEYLSWRRSWTARNERSAGERLTELGDARSLRHDRYDHAQDTVDADDLWRRLGTLPRKQRAVLVLRYYEQLEDATIARLVGCSPATVRSHASKALKTLRLDSRQQALTHVQETR